MPNSQIWKRVRETSRCDWSVTDRELSGASNYVGLYGGEHIAATEFVISATDIIIGLIIGNILAVLSFTFFCAVLATDTRLSLF